MKWTKCSEKMPDKADGNVLFKVYGNAWYGHFETYTEKEVLYLPTKQEYYDEIDWSDFEWLDENDDSDAEKAFLATRERFWSEPDREAIAKYKDYAHYKSQLLKDQSTSL